MKIVIEHSETKRRINGPFNICGSGDDLELIAQTILKRLKEGRGYGWVFITARQGSIVDTPPEPWDESTG